MSGYNHAPEFMYAQGSNRNEMEIVGRTSTGYLGYKLGTSAYSNFKAPLDISYNIRRTISMTSNTLVMVTAGYTNSVHTVSAAQAINTDLSNVKLQLGTATEGNYFAPMKIYGLKIYESDALVKDYRPTVTNGVSGLYDLCGSGFYPLAGGKVSGAKSKGVAFQIEPQPMTLKHIGARRTGTLTCLAAGAQSYEWYENGVLMSGKTSNSLALEWSEAKAKSANNIYTYSVKPVYTVFNEKVVGDAATTTVEYMSPQGFVLIIR